MPWQSATASLQRSLSAADFTVHFCKYSTHTLLEIAELLYKLPVTISQEQATAIAK